MYYCNSSCRLCIKMRKQYEKRDPTSPKYILYKLLQSVRQFIHKQFPYQTAAAATSSIDVVLNMLIRDLDLDRMTYHVSSKVVPGKHKSKLEAVSQASLKHFNTRISMMSNLTKAEKDILCRAQTAIINMPK
jgi:hypothetical protein